MVKYGEGEYPYNYCPAHNDSSGQYVEAFYCLLRVRLYGLQYVYCCGNNTYRFCCREQEDFYLGPLTFSDAALFWYQYWPAVVFLCLAVIAGLIAMCTRSCESRTSNSGWN